MKPETSASKSSTKVVLVTGASSGIGAATAQRLVRAGYRVYGTSRRGAGPDGGNFEMLTLDVTDDDSVDEVVAQVMAQAGRIDVLVNNAGFGVSPAGAEESSLDQARAIFDTNFFGVIRMTRAVLPHMRALGNGRIINIGSVLGLLPMPYGALYSATKHALEGYSESLDHETRTRGIRVSVIEPAFTQTRFDANLMVPDAMRDEYRQIRAHLNTLLPTQIAKGDDPGVVADIVLRAATARQPRARYTAGKSAAVLALLRRIAPAAMVDRGIRQSFKLDAVNI
ncbi:MAG: oxidoreductase [Gammaproteobacteria bacterium]|nr:oxidoreductase [Gammaproteobacteria bacterium]